jgi:hypothetical protein
MLRELRPRPAPKHHLSSVSKLAAPRRTGESQGVPRPRDRPTSKRFCGVIPGALGTETCHDVVTSRVRRKRTDWDHHGRSAQVRAVADTARNTSGHHHAAVNPPANALQIRPHRRRSHHPIWGTGWGPHVMRDGERPARLWTSRTGTRRPQTAPELRECITALSWGQVVAGSNPVSPTSVSAGEMPFLA